MNDSDEHVSLKIYEQKAGARQLLRLEGSLNANSAGYLDRYFKGIDPIVREVFLDLSKLRYISSGGLRIIIVMLKAMKAKGGRMVINAVSDAVREVFNLTGLLDIFVRDERLVVVEKERTMDRAVYTAAGVMDVDTLPIIQSVLFNLAGSGLEEVVLDCAKVTSVSQEALQSLKYETERLAAKGTSVVTSNLKEPPPINADESGPKPHAQTGVVKGIYVTGM